MLKCTKTEAIEVSGESGDSWVRHKTTANKSNSTTHCFSFIIWMTLRVLPYTFKMYDHIKKNMCSVIIAQN